VSRFTSSRLAWSTLILPSPSAETAAADIFAQAVKAA
jgi:hypothetical protein